MREIQAQIVKSDFREIFLAADRELIASFDEREFAEYLVPSQKFLSGNYKTISEGKTNFDDLASRLKRFLGRPFNLYTSFLLENETDRASEVFSWKVRGSEIKLVHYEMKISN